MTLEPGDRIKTGAASNAVITFFDGSTIELKAGTEVGVTELDVAEDTGSTTIKLWQEIGKTRSRVEKLVDPASRYEIETPAGAAVVRGSTGDVHVAGNGTTVVYNIEGLWCAIGQKKEVCIPEGMYSTIVVGQEPSAPMATAAPPPPSLPSLPGLDGGGGDGDSLQEWTQTTVKHFGAGITDNVMVLDVGGGDGTVMLDSSDQSNRVCSQSYHDIYCMNYQAQTFRAGVTGNLTRIDLYLAKIGTPHSLVIELRNCNTASEIEPGSTVYASITTENVSSAGVYRFNFSIPHRVVAGTDYSLVLYELVCGENIGAYYRWCEAVENPYHGGMVWESSDYGYSWQKGAEGAHDFYFATYIDDNYPSSGTLKSSKHRCVGVSSASFDRIFWDSAVPGGTVLRFQIATKASMDGQPWNFVGPDGTSSTYYETSGTDIWSGHNGDCYIRYRAYLSTTDRSRTPELEVVTITYR